MSDNSCYKSSPLKEFSTTISTELLKTKMLLEKEQRSPESIHALKQIKALIELMEKIENIIPLFDNEKKPYSVNLLLQLAPLKKLKSIFYTKNYALYQIIKEALEETLTKTPLHENAPSIIEFLRQKQFELMAETNNIPGENIEVAFNNMIECIENIQPDPNKHKFFFQICNKISTTLFPAETDKFNITIAHPAIFKLVETILQQLQNTPTELKELIPFFNAHALDMDFLGSGFINNRIKSEAKALFRCVHNGTPSDTKVFNYTFTHTKFRTTNREEEATTTTNTLDGQNAYAEFKENPQVFNSELNRYFARNTAHVKILNARSTLFKQFIEQEALQNNQSITTYQQESQVDPSTSTSSSEEIIRINNAIEHSRSILEKNKALQKHLEGKKESYNTCAFSELITQYPDLIAHRDKYTTNQINTDFCTATLPDFIIDAPVAGFIKIKAQLHAHIDQHLNTLKEHHRSLCEKIRIYENQILTHEEQVISAHRDTLVTASEHLNTLQKEFNLLCARNNESPQNSKELLSCAESLSSQLNEHIDYIKQSAIPKAELISYGTHQRIRSALQRNIEPLMNQAHRLSKTLIELKNKLQQQEVMAECEQTVHFAEIAELFTDTQDSHQRIDALHQQLERLKQQLGSEYNEAQNIDNEIQNILTECLTQCQDLNVFASKDSPTKQAQLLAKDEHEAIALLDKVLGQNYQPTTEASSKSDLGDSIKKIFNRSTKEKSKNKFIEKMNPDLREHLTTRLNTLKNLFTLRTTYRTIDEVTSTKQQITDNMTLSTRSEKCFMLLQAYDQKIKEITSDNTLNFANPTLYAELDALEESSKTLAAHINDVQSKRQTSRPVSNSITQAIEKINELFNTLNRQHSNVVALKTDFSSLQEQLDTSSSQLNSIENQQDKTLEDMVAEYKSIAATISSLNAQLANFQNHCARISENRRPNLKALVENQQKVHEQMLCTRNNLLNKLEQQLNKPCTKVLIDEMDLEPLTAPETTEQVNRIKLTHYGLKIKDQRQRTVNDMLSKLDIYWENRCIQYTLKDKMFPQDKNQRLKFIQELKNTLQDYIDTGDSEAVLKQTLILDKTHKRTYYPGKNLQTLLNKISVEILDTEYKIATPDIPTLDESNNQVQDILNNYETNHPAYVKSVNRLYQLIDDTYKKWPEHTLELTKKLRYDLNLFILRHPQELPDKEAFTQFKRHFTARLHSEEALFNTHRDKWTANLLNFGIALSVLGSVILLGRLIYTKIHHGHSSLFFAETQRQQHLNLIEKALDTELTAMNNQPKL